MTWDISAGRIRAGLTAGDVSQDAVLQVAMDQALALAELYCNRYFLYATQTDTFTSYTHWALSLTRYPIESFSSASPAMSGGGTHPTVTDPAITSAWAIGLPVDGIDQDAGVIRIRTALNPQEQKITYTGGYKTLPDDLELALWMIFDATKAAGAGATGSLGGVKRASLTGVGSVDFDLGSSAATGGGGMGGFMSPAATSILDLYVRERV